MLTALALAAPALMPTELGVIARPPWVLDCQLGVIARPPCVLGVIAL